VINTTTNKVTATIDVGSFPTGVAVSPCGARAYVTNYGSATVSVINTMSGWRRYGKGHHPAGLNFGDCFTYALAERTGHPVLCTGNGFAATDIAVLRPKQTPAEG
jgi:DNA-binding beta-propeller fold protein YncE